MLPPGDSLTFLGATEVTGVVDINPIFGVDFTNESYLTFDDIFTNGLDDVDNDTNSYQYHDHNDIDLSDGLDSTMEEQFGAITAMVNSDVPDGTVITGTFYVVNPSFGIQTLMTQKAMAAADDLYLRSTIKMIVSDPAQVAAESPTSLPVTGADSQSKLPYSLLPIWIIITSGMTYYFLKYAKK